MSDIILTRLYEMQDTVYRDFTASLLPSIEKDRFIGVRMPALRALAKSLAGTKEAESFLSELPHRYHEENCLHAFLIERIKDYPATIEALDRFLPYVDNWATCDSMRPKCLAKHLPKFLLEIRRYLASDHTYTVRFGIEMLMSFYLDAHFDPIYLEEVAEIRSDAYYIRMMVAWYFATALAKQWEAAIPLIEERRLQPWVHNKTIQKAVESYRITKEQKAYLRTMKIR